MIPTGKEAFRSRFSHYSRKGPFHHNNTTLHSSILLRDSLSILSLDLDSRYPSLGPEGSRHSIRYSHLHAWQTPREPGVPLKDPGAPWICCLAISKKCDNGHIACTYPSLVSKYVWNQCGFSAAWVPPSVKPSPCIPRHTSSCYFLPQGYFFENPMMHKKFRNYPSPCYCAILKSFQWEPQILKCSSWIRVTVMIKSIAAPWTVRSKKWKTLETLFYPKLCR